MQILYFNNGDILAIGDIAAQGDGSFRVQNNPYDISDYTLSGFEKEVNLAELTAEIPNNFKLWEWDFDGEDFITKQPKEEVPQLTDKERLTLLEKAFNERLLGGF